MTYPGPSDVAEMIADAGGTIVGRTRLQKCACALELTGLGNGFRFSYRHFGPFSEQLQTACGDAEALGLISEEERTANWGGHYSIFSIQRYKGQQSADDRRPPRVDLLKIMAAADSIALELAVTAAFLADGGVRNAWEAVIARKSDKTGSMDAARDLYRQMMAVRTPKQLPDIA